MEPIRILLNGQPHQVTPPFTLKHLLEELNLNSNSALAIALNHEVIPRSQLDAQVLNADDEVEIIQPVGGG